jgi:acyl carrier protein
MKQIDFTRQKVLKIVNSRMDIVLKDNNLCQMDLRKELGVSQKDMNVLSSMLEKMFNVLIEDEELGNVNSVDDFVRLIELKQKEYVDDLVLEK